MRLGHSNRSVLGCGASRAVLFLALTIWASMGTAQEKTPTGVSPVVGVWKGFSKCVDPNHFPACQNEVVVFRIPSPPDSTGKLTMNLNKIVAGKEEEMGALDFMYDPARRVLTNEFMMKSTHGVWEFTVLDSTMIGTLTVFPENLLARRVNLTKVVETTKTDDAEK